MLTRFGIDPDALTVASESDHQRLSREWMRYGILCYNTETFAESELADAVESLPQSARILWKKLVKTAWMHAAPWCGWQDLEDHPDQASILNGSLDLACLDETRRELIREDIQKTCPNLELSLFSDLDTSEAFERTHQISEQRTNKVKVSELWKERFALPSSMTRNITIVDRYALTDGEAVNGLEAFLILLDGAARKVNVTVFSSYGDESRCLAETEAQDRVVGIRSRLARGGVGDISLFLTESRNFGRIEHDRFLKFDHLVFEIGSGMAVFNGKYAKQSTFSSKLWQDGHKTTLKELRRLCSAAYPVFI
jgi:hypothetical protein